MKKLINKIGIITFGLSSIVAIASTPSSSLASDSSQFKIIQSFQTKHKKSFKNSKWAIQTQSNSDSNITNGLAGTIFEDSGGNLWSMGYKTPLQKYNYQTKKWTKDSSSNIIDGNGGTIFEDSRGNLWSMGKGTPLQKYNYTTKKWTAETSNITNGAGGTIFEDSRGNLWSMGNGTPLQKYNYTTKRWIAKTNGSNITDGAGGTLFEDSRGNLWSMGYKTPLQKYNYQTKKWTAKTNGSNIIDGSSGTIFEDSRGNLWSMGKGTPLQKYNYTTKRWTVETSNITNGVGGTIFEDSRGNLWSMGKRAPLQKYNYTTRRWTVESSGNNINDGYYGTIFEDSRGNLWSMGFFTPLQKYNYTTKRWTAESSGNNITNGWFGTIFEDSRGNLWSMGFNTKLQRLTPTKETSLDDQKVKDFNIEFKTKINLDSKIVILIKGYREYKSSLFTHLQYKKKTESNWKAAKKRAMILDATEYEFKWVLGDEEIFASNQNFPQKITIKSNGSIETINSFQQIDIAKAKAFLNTLSNETISSLVNNAKSVSAITKLEVLALIQAAKGYSALTGAQKALITTEDLISLSENPVRTLKVTITFKGETYELIKGGFKLNLETEANKFKNFTSSDSSKSKAAILKASSKNVLNMFKKISGYQRPANLASGVTITRAVVRNALNSQTKKVTFELTIAHQDEVTKKDVIVTFKALKVIPKPNKKELNKKGSSGLSAGAIVGISIGSIFGIGIIGFLTFYFVRGNKK